MSEQKGYVIERARSLVLQYGWNSTSFQIINPGIKRWFSARGDAVVGYTSAGGFRVVVGAPVCELKRLNDAAAEFEADAAASNERVCYFAAESRLEATVAATHSKFLIGSQPSWNPSVWPEIVARHRSLRAQLNRAKNKGVTVTEWTSPDASDHPELRRCLALWLKSKGLPPLHFMVEPDTLSRLENRRIFVAAGRDGRVVGFTVLSPVACRDGWLIEQFPHVPGAPNGTVELMIDAAMRAVAADGCRYATLGLAPLSQRAADEQIENPLWLRIILAWLREHGKRFYNFGGLERFKAKLRPERWEPVFAVSNETDVSFKTLYAITSAFSGGRPFSMVAGGFRRAAATEFRRFRSYLDSTRIRLIRRLSTR